MKAALRPILLVLLVAALVSADDSKKKDRPESAAAKSADEAKSREMGFTPSREAAALTFVKEHHPELARLLGHLKQANDAEYRKAIANLFRTSEKLTALKERNTVRYEYALQQWKLQSRIRVLAARLTMGASPELEAELKALLLEQVDLRIEQLTAEKASLQGRIEKLDSTIENLSARREAAAEEQYDRLLRSLQANPRPKKKTSDNDTTAKADSPKPRRGTGK